MPPRSQAQREAMHAAAEGHSTLGIPKKIGEEFDEADEGEKLPKKVKKEMRPGGAACANEPGKPALPTARNIIGKEAGLVKRIMRAFKMNEISAVDRPAQAHAKVVIMKRDGSNGIEHDESGNITFKRERDLKVSDLPGYADPIVGLSAEDIAYLGKRDFSASARRSAASSGDALPDGSFPIKNKEDLANARRLVGHSKNPAAARALISRRAKELGVSTDDDAKKHELRKILTDIFEGHLSDASAEDMEKTIEEFTKLESDMTDDEIKKAVDEAVITATKELTEKLAKAEEELAKAKEKPVDVEKAELPEDIKKALAKAEATEIILKQLMDERETAEYAKRAVKLGLEEVHGEVLRKAFSGDKAGQADLEKLMKGMSEQIRTGKIFAEFGKAGIGVGATAADEMKLAADAYREGQVKIGKKCSPQQAFTAVYIDPAHADLKKRYDDEEIKKRHAA